MDNWRKLSLALSNRNSKTGAVSLNWEVSTMSTTEYEPTEIEYVEQLMDDLGLKGSDTLDDLISALEDEQTEDGED
jgi:hypothetical protein